MTGIKGIGAVLTNDTGDVVAHAFDFERQSYGGFELWQAQRIRAKKAVMWKYIQSYCYGDMAAGIDDYLAEQIISKMRDKKKLKLTFVAVGYEDISPRELN